MWIPSSLHVCWGSPWSLPLLKLSLLYFLFTSRCFRIPRTVNPWLRLLSRWSPTCPPPPMGTVFRSREKAFTSFANVFIIFLWKQFSLRYPPGYVPFISYFWKRSTVQIGQTMNFFWETHKGRGLTGTWDFFVLFCGDGYCNSISKLSNVKWLVSFIYIIFLSSSARLSGQYRLWKIPVCSGRAFVTVLRPSASSELLGKQPFSVLKQLRYLLLYFQPSVFDSSYSTVPGMQIK